MGVWGIGWVECLDAAGVGDVFDFSGGEDVHACLVGGGGFKRGVIGGRGCRVCTAVHVNEGIGLTVIL